MTASRRWRDVADSPDLPEVIEWREELIRRTSRSPLATYRDVVAAYCSERRVLDFGAANHGVATVNIAGEATHDVVASHAASVVAVDVVNFRGGAHANCRYITANLLLDEEWRRAGIDQVEVLFAGHVIEHLDGPGELFELARKALVPTGLLVVVTPNPLWLPGLWSRAGYRNVSVNPDHVALFGAGELAELGERHGFELAEWRYAGRADMSPTFRVPGRLKGPLVDAFYRFCRRRDLAFAHNSLVATFERGN